MILANAWEVSCSEALRTSTIDRLRRQLGRAVAPNCTKVVRRPKSTEFFTHVVHRQGLIQKDCATLRAFLALQTSDRNFSFMYSRPMAAHEKARAIDWLKWISLCGSLTFTHLLIIPEAFDCTSTYVDRVRRAYYKHGPESASPGEPLITG